jgi:acyl carrier protein
MFNRIKNILLENIEIDIDEVSVGTNFFDDLGLDSIEFYDIIISTEDEFGITIDESEIYNIVIIQDLIDLIEKKKENKKYIE